MPRANQGQEERTFELVGEEIFRYPGNAENHEDQTCENRDSFPHQARTSGG